MNCIKNDMDSNIFVLITNIFLPNILVVAPEFKDFNPSLELSDNIMKKGINYSKKYLKRR